MRMLTQRICMALSGLGRLQMVDTAMRPRAAMLLQDVASAPWGIPPAPTVLRLPLLTC